MELMEFNSENWKKLLKLLNFTEQESPRGGKQVYDDKGEPLFSYLLKETQGTWFIFLNGAAYMKLNNG